ncbi:MAG: hypothetical protein LC798_05315 [Chloroflexi bacterium]|nr:hypothetical protein [Chloroflexota bacterium]
MEWLAALGGLASLLVAIPILWKTVITPAARRIAERSITEPILEELAKSQPPVIARLDRIEHRLDRIEDRERSR